MDAATIRRLRGNINPNNARLQAAIDAEQAQMAKEAAEAPAAAATVPEGNAEPAGAEAPHKETLLEKVEHAIEQTFADFAP